MRPPAIEVAVGLCASRGSRTVDAGAGGGDGLLVVADGLGGHCTGWLGARLLVRVLFDRLAPTDANFVGAAVGFPDEWGWAGAMQPGGAGEFVYGECIAALGDVAALPGDLPGLLRAIDEVVRDVPPRHRINGLMVGCIAAVVADGRVRGVHAGVGRVLLLRAGTDAFESLVVEHYMHLVYTRLTEARVPEGVEVPRNIIFNGVGCLDYAKIGIDEFAVELAAGDLLILCSQRLDVREEELARVARAALDAGVPLAALARDIETRAAAVFPEPEAHRATDVAFALALAR